MGSPSEEGGVTADVRPEFKDEKKEQQRDRKKKNAARGRRVTYLTPVQDEEDVSVQGFGTNA